MPPSEAFPYLGRKIINNNSDWAAVYQNMSKTRRRWGMIVRVLTNTGETVQAQGIIYKALAQSVILYVSEGWVVTD